MWITCICNVVTEKKQQLLFKWVDVEFLNPTLELNYFIQVLLLKDDTYHCYITCLFSINHVKVCQLTEIVSNA